MEPIKVIVASSKATWLAKLTLRGISAVIAIALIGVVSSIAAQGTYDDYYGYSYSDGYIPLAVIGAQLILSVCWTIAEIVCLIVRTGHLGIHPGACVIMDLIIWLGLIIGVVMLAVLCWGGWCGYDYDEYGDGDVSRRNAMIALGVILTVAHFILFVIACWETSVRNRAVRVILDRNGELLKGPEAAYKAYQNYQAQSAPAAQPVPQPPPVAFAPAPAPVPGHLYPTTLPSRRPVASEAPQASSNPGRIPSPSEVSSVGPVAPNPQ